MMFIMDNNKAPEPDDYKAYFSKQNWEIIGEDVIKAIQNFFSLGHLLQEVNFTILSLIPKVANPFCCKDYRPIAC